LEAFEVKLPFHTGIRPFTEEERECEAQATRERLHEGMRQATKRRRNAHYAKPFDPKIADLWRRMTGERDD
jgi:hypothetical protein